MHIRGYLTPAPELAPTTEEATSSAAEAVRITAEPEFCPNAACRFHDRKEAAEYQWYIRFGSFHTRCRGSIGRFRCTGCGKTCSTQTFSVHYWSHATNDLLWLLEHLYGCTGLRQIARYAGVTHRVVQNRIRRLARGALAVMDLALGELALTENLAMDGFESYTRSQYHPNNITHITGSRSQFIYAAIATLLRRKGAMSERQKRTRSLIESLWRPPRPVRSDCTALLGDLCSVIESACERLGSLRLATDRHRGYPAALASVEALRRQLAAGRLEHHCTSSRAARTSANALFAVNYVDREIRKSMSEHVRETVRQGRELNCQMERMAIFMVVHNFLTPHRIDGRSRAALSSTRAQVAEVTSDAVRRQLERMVTHRHVCSHLRGGYEWIERIWGHRYENPPAVRLVNGELRARSVALGPGELPQYLVV